MAYFLTLKVRQAKVKGMFGAFHAEGYLDDRHSTCGVSSYHKCLRLRISKIPFNDTIFPAESYTMSNKNQLY